VSGFKKVNIKKSNVIPISNPIENGFNTSKPVEGCDNALLAGEKNGVLNKNYTGNLYIECAGDGDAGFMDLTKTGRKTYKGRFVAPNGKADLGLDDEEEVALTCTKN